MPFDQLFWGREFSYYNRLQEKSWYPYSNLSTGGPRSGSEWLWSSVPLKGSVRHVVFGRRSGSERVPLEGSGTNVFSGRRRGLQQYWGRGWGEIKLAVVGSDFAALLGIGGGQTRTSTWQNWGGGWESNDGTCILISLPELLDLNNFVGKPSLVANKKQSGPWTSLFFGGGHPSQV